jgi:diguanylate cyclase (GGDEF)-like protein
MPPVRSIKSNILAFAVLATLIPSIGLGIMFFVGYEDLVKRNVTYELRSQAKDAATELTLWVRERAHDVRTLSTAYTLIDGLGGGTPRPGAVRIGASELALYLQSVQKKLEPILELTVRDASGQVIASSASEPALVTLPPAWQSASVTTGLVVVPPRWDDARATSTVTVAVPVLSLRNELLGALLAVLDLRQAAPRLRSVVEGSNAEIIVLASDGTPLLTSAGAVSSLARLDPTALDRLRSNTGEPSTYIDFHGREAIGTAAVPPSLSALVVAQRDRAEVFAAWLRLMERYAALVLGLTLLVGIVGYWMGRSIVTPVNSLTRVADRVASGDLTPTPHDDTKDEIGRLTRAFGVMTQRLRTSQAELEAANETLRRQNEALETLATTDSLTGLYNRKKLDEMIAEHFARFERDHMPFALLMIAVDNLNAINADYGLPSGDDVLIKIAAMLKLAVREGDQVARFGGERFVAILADVPFDFAMDLADYIRTLIEAPDIVDNHAILTSVSIGVAQSRDGDTDPDSILFRADHALHEAQRIGGNRVQSAM